MNATKKKKLESAGFRVGSVQEFLGLSDEETTLIDLKVRLVRMLRPTRERARVTQDELAQPHWIQPVARGENGRASPDVSLDLICKALLALGMTRQRIGKAIADTRAA